jgi:hypothetical protein
MVRTDCLAVSNLPELVMAANSLSGNYIKLYHKFLLCLRNVEKSDEGVYVCRASNEGGYSDGLMWLLIQSEFFMLRVMFLLW